MVAELYVAIPESNITTETMQLEEIDYSGSQKVHHTHEGVGSGKHMTS